MTRKLIPLVAATALFAGACASGSSSGRSVTSTAPASQQQGTAAEGRGRGSGQGRGGQREELLLRGITLTASQQQQVDSIRAKYRDQFGWGGRREGGERPTDEQRQRMMAQRRAAMEKQSAEIRAVLTPEQQKQFDANLAEMQQRMQQRGGRPNGRRQG